MDFGPKVDAQVLDKTLNELKSHDGVKEAVFRDGAIMVDTSLPSSRVLEMVMNTSGKRAVLQGFGGKIFNYFAVKEHNSNRLSSGKYRRVLY